MVASTCANMGLDAKDVNVVVSVAPFTSDWELKQGEGRAGRGGQQALSIILGRAVSLSKAVVTEGQSKLQLNLIKPLING